MGGWTDADILKVAKPEGKYRSLSLSFLPACLHLQIAFNFSYKTEM